MESPCKTCTRTDPRLCHDRDCAIWTKWFLIAWDKARAPFLKLQNNKQK